MPSLGMVNGTPGFDGHPAVIDGYAELMTEVFGEEGWGARSAVGMGSLPLGISVEIEAIFVRPPFAQPRFRSSCWWRWSCCWCCWCCFQSRSDAVRWVRWVTRRRWRTRRPRRTRRRLGSGWRSWSRGWRSSRPTWTRWSTRSRRASTRSPPGSERLRSRTQPVSRPYFQPAARIFSVIPSFTFRLTLQTISTIPLPGSTPAMPPIHSHTQDV